VWAKPNLLFALMGDIDGLLQNAGDRKHTLGVGTLNEIVSEVCEQGVGSRLVGQPYRTSYTTRRDRFFGRKI